MKSRPFVIAALQTCAISWAPSGWTIQLCSRRRDLITCRGPQRWGQFTISDFSVSPVTAGWSCPLCFSAILVISSFPVSSFCLVDRLQCCIFKNLVPPVARTKFLKYSGFAGLANSICHAHRRSAAHNIFMLIRKVYISWLNLSFSYYFRNWSIYQQVIFKRKKKKKNSQWGRYGRMTDDTNQHCMSFLLDQNYYFDLLPSVCDSLSGCLWRVHEVLHLPRTNTDLSD